MRFCPTLSIIGCRMITGVGYIIVFAFGLYLGRGAPYPCILQNYDAVDIDFTKTLTNISEHVTLKQSFYNLGMKFRTDKVTFHRYDALYEKYLSKYIGTNVSILEIGLGCDMDYGTGASAYLWRHYFGHQAEIHFIEFNRKCAEQWQKTRGNKLNITVHFGSQDDIAFLDTVNNSKGYFDIIVDDGGHHMKQQITSFTHLFPKMRSEGIYVIEDLQTSYMRIPDAGYLVNTSTIEFIKRLIDSIHGMPPKNTIKLGELISSFEIIYHEPLNYRVHINNNFRQKMMTEVSHVSISFIYKEQV